MDGSTTRASRTRCQYLIPGCRIALPAARVGDYHRVVEDTGDSAWADGLNTLEPGDSETHVWRIPLANAQSAEQHLALLSEDERVRVRRFYFPKHGIRYAVAHSALRQILAQYTSTRAVDLQFATGEHGKPELTNAVAHNGQSLQFNLSHSGDMALVAVSRHGAVGVDVERWRDHIQHLEIAERFFSEYEREALRSLPGDVPAGEPILRGFFSTWSRKEAYLKATGQGISRGLHHFDVTMARTPDDQQAELLADRLDPTAVGRWVMYNIHVAPGYSAALVTTRPPGIGPGAVRLFDSPYM